MSARKGPASLVIASRFALSLGVAVFALVSGGGVAFAEGTGDVAVSEQQVSAVQRLADTRTDHYTGVVINRQTHRLQVYVTANGQSSARADLAGLSRHADSGSPKLTVQFIPAKYSLRQLNHTMARITTAQPWESLTHDLRSMWYVDPQRDSVVVGLTAITPARSFQDHIVRPRMVNGLLM